jgi:Putative peptidoglycan binding domain
MWIWELGSSNGGNVNSIVSKAHHYGVSTMMIKSGDGASAWSQFSRALISTLHASGLRVCAWQYVYGVHPGGEAKVGAAAVADGADCLLIDAESEYEGRYVSAQTYIRTLRHLIGAGFPVALAGFPYVDFHPAFPYSVFLGPGGAQYNVPQMYWFDIGTSVDHVYAHTYAFNRIYQRKILPLGQVYNSPPARDIRRFRQLSRSYGAQGVSWWDWQEATNGAWRAVSQPIGGLSGFTPDTSFASLGQGAQGDVVVWAQEHLVGAGDAVQIDGGFGLSTKIAVENFQAAHGLPVDGLIGTATWQALLRYAPAAVRWTNSGARTASAASVAGGTPLPKSAFLRAKRNEIARAGGAGRPTR